jgi:protein-tyrosine phosphatase
VNVGFICTGNICRSPMAEVVMRSLVREAGLAERVRVSSAGTANWHVGEAMDDRARQALDRAGFTEPGSAARFASAEYLSSLGIVVVMTREHRVDVVGRCPTTESRVVLLRSIGGRDDADEVDLADPYYDDAEGFDACLGEITRSCRLLIRGLR